MSLWGATSEQRYLAEEFSSDDPDSRVHYESGDTFPHRSLSNTEGSDGLHGVSINASLDGTNYSMPTRNLSDLDSEAQSTATANGSLIDTSRQNPRDALLIDLGPEVPVIVRMEGGQKDKIEDELHRASFGGSLSEKLTGDDSGTNPEMSPQLVLFPGPPRPVALSRSDRCITPQRSNARRNSIVPGSPGSPQSTQNVSEIFHYTYEPDPRSPVGQVPPFVVVPSYGVARVTTRRTDRALQNVSTPAAPQNPNQELLKKASIFALIAILILALITLAAGIVRANEQAHAGFPVPETPQTSIPATLPPAMPERTPTLSVVNPASSPSTIPSPTATPVFSIPNEDFDGDFPDLGGGVVGREETLSPTSSDYVAPTRAPRTKRPTSSPTTASAASSFLEETVAPSVSQTNSTTTMPAYNDTAWEYEANMRAYLQSLIATVSPQSSTMFNIPSSPQHYAFEWLVSDQVATDPILSEDRIIQRFALAVFFFSTSGLSWTTSTLWLTLNNECDWYETRARSICDENGIMHTLQLESNEVSGSLPAELGLMSLKRLFLRNNRISGTIPAILGSLERLEHVQLTNNLFKGPIPTEFGNLRNLVVLGLGRNDLSGSIPTELGLLSSLDSLGLEGNMVGGSIPTEFGAIGSLRFVSMRSNFLSGDVPSEIGNLSGLAVFKVEENDLSGNMSLDVCRLRNSTLSQLTADCDEIWCDCCTNCRSDGKLLGGDP